MHAVDERDVGDVHEQPLYVPWEVRRRVEHWAPPEVAADGPNRWLVVGFYDNEAVRTPAGWRLSAVKLTATYQENASLLAATMAAVND